MRFRLPLPLLLTFCLWLSAGRGIAVADDAVGAALAAAQAAWPQAQITALSANTPCAAATFADAPGAVRGGETQVRVRCTAVPGWTRYLRLRVQARGPVAVLRVPLSPLQPLTADLVSWEIRDTLALSGDTLSRPEQIVGQLARRELPPGTVLGSGLFSAPAAIQRGQTVMLVSRIAGMEVRAPGEALADASVGTRVRVRNSASRRVVEGIAHPDGTVEVAL